MLSKGFVILSYKFMDADDMNAVNALGCNYLLIPLIGIETGIKFHLFGFFYWTPGLGQKGPIK